MPLTVHSRAVYPRVCGGTVGEGRSNAQMLVYPRVCGGTTGWVAARGYLHGLSPRVRGNQVIPVLLVGENGSIPACAGEPVSWIERRYDPQVYPACAGEPSLMTGSTVCAAVYPRVCGGTPGR